MNPADDMVISRTVDVKVQHLCKQRFTGRFREVTGRAISRMSIPMAFLEVLLALLITEP